MNIIDALFVTLGLDTRDYEKKQKEAEASLKKFGETSGKQTKLIAESGKKAASAFSSLKIEILGALAAFGMGAGFKAFIESSVTGEAALGRLSATLGMSAHQLQAWKLAAKEMGGAGSEAIDSLQTVAKGMAEAKIHGTSALIQASRRFGFSVSNDPAQTLVNISRRMAQMHDPQQALQVAEAAGISNFTMQQMLLQGPERLQAQLAHTMALTGAATKASTEQAEQIQAKWADVQEQFRQVGERAFVKLEPVLEKLVTQLSNWVDSVDWDKVITTLGNVFDDVQKIIHALGGVKGILIEIAAIKVFGWAANIASTILQLRTLTGALRAAQAAAAGGSIPAGGVPGAVPGAVATGGFWSKLLGAGGFLGLLRAAAFAPRPSEGGIKAVQDATARAAGDHESYWQKWGDVFHWRTQGPKVGKPVSAQAAAMQYLMQNGLSKAQAAGIVGNLMQESSLNPQAVSRDGRAFGLMQLRGDRVQSFQHVMGVPIQRATAMQQLQYLVWELHHSEKRAYEALQKTTTAGEAAKAFGLLDERFGNDGSLAKRIAYANAASMAYVGAKSSSAAKAGTSTTQNDVHIGSITVQTKATDANGIANDMGKAVRANPLIAGYVTAAA